MLKLDRKEIGIMVALVILMVGLILPYLFDLDASETRAIAILLFATFLWSTESIDPSIVSLAIIVFIPLFGVLPYDRTMQQMGNVIIWRLMGIFIFTAAVNKSGIDRRLALKILKLAKGNVRLFFFLFIIMNAAFTFLIPNNMAKAMIILTMVNGLLNAYEIKRGSNIGKSIFTTLALLSLITSTSVIVGSTSTMYTATLFRELTHFEFTYLSWLITNLPISFLTALSMYFISLRIFPPEIEVFPGGTAIISDEIQKLGPLTTSEKKITVIFSILLFLWITDFADFFSAELFVALIIVLPRIGLLTWKEAVSQVNWGILLLFGAGLTLAEALRETNVITDITQVILASVNDLPPLALAATIFCITVLLRIGMSNMLGLIATFMPVVINLGQSVGINPVWIGLITLFASSVTFLPAQSPPGLITYAYGFYSSSDLIKSGMGLALVMFVLTLFSAFFYWPYVGIQIYMQ
jgi:solute carrier family 13 (sodium-dependent dicarboxylate transporter), member 2/3/5